MSRHYRAFISYRHLPLEKKYAKMLHRKIEHFIIPSALRKNGEKHIGYVFRDQDELPISGKLSGNIEEALDNSDYLIVICSPETSNSKWVLREISYFLERHDRDHVLLLLASGHSKESIPAQLRETRDEEGNLIDSFEPLAASIVSDTDTGRDRLFKTEVLRILAALIGCSYDDLYRREQRYKRRITAAVFAGAAVIASIFIGMLLNRNAMIREQLMNSLRNESLALAELSASHLRKLVLARETYLDYVTFSQNCSAIRKKRTDTRKKYY